MDQDEVRNRIQIEHDAAGHELGWRLLYQPWRTIDEADIVFIGLNPGGRFRPADHGELSLETGSAYVHESWKSGKKTYDAGDAPLQRQVTSLFRDRLGVEPEAVLAGNLVPFRSPRWDDLVNKTGSLKFGLDLWDEILRQRPRKLVITLGQDTYRAIRNHRRDFVDDQFEPQGWGRVSRSRCDEYRLVGLPHLSIFKIVNRDANREALDWAFGP